MSNANEGYETSPEPFTLECGHIMRLRPSVQPKPGELLWCPLCRKDTHRLFTPESDKAGNVIPIEWHWICKKHNACNSGNRKFGQDSQRAKSSAYLHGRKYPLHEVWVISPDGKVTERWGPDSLEAPEPLFGKTKDQMRESRRSGSANVKSGRKR